MVRRYQEIPALGSFFSINRTNFDSKFPSIVGGYPGLYNITLGVITQKPLLVPLPDGEEIILDRKYQFVASAVIRLFLSPFRAEELHPAAFACVLGLYVFTFILLILFSKRQPLKSRGFVPYIACIFHFIMLLSGLVTFLPRKLDPMWSQSVYASDIYWIWYTYFKYAFLLSIIFMSVFLGMRYVLLTNVKARKQLFVEDSELKVVKMKLIWRIVKWVGHWGVSLIILCVSYFVFAFYLSLIWIPVIGEDYRHPNRDHYYFYAMLIVLLLFALLVGVADFITNFRRIRSCQFKQLWMEDVFYFRMELYVIVVLVLTPYFLVFYIILNDSWLPQVWYVNESYHALYYIVNTLTFLMLFLFQVGFVLIITIFNWFRDKMRKPASKSKLVVLLENPKFVVLFTEYCLSEFSVENISCFIDIIQYKKNTENRKDRANRIRVLYLMGADSELEVNLVRKDIEEAIRRIEKEDFGDDIFEKIALECLQNIHDTFSRFSVSLGYQAFLLEENLVENLNDL